MIMGAHGVRRFLNSMRAIFTQAGRKSKRLKDQMRNANSYQEWQKCADTLDEHEGFDVWRQEPPADSKVRFELIPLTLFCMMPCSANRHCKSVLTY